MKLQFTIPGPPIPKERARVTIRRTSTGKTQARAFTPERTTNYGEHVRLHALAARCAAARWPWQDSKVRYGIRIEIHRSARRGDWDNFAKAITDPCNGTIWPDDRQISYGFVEIIECVKGAECAKVEVWVIK
jgi:Holliday junction resolvase RusA-like endonuclease